VVTARFVNGKSRIEMNEMWPRQWESEGARAEGPLEGGEILWAKSDVWLSLTHGQAGVWMESGGDGRRECCKRSRFFNFVLHVVGVPRKQTVMKPGV
jgi:hypothetical protein